MHVHSCISSYIQAYLHAYNMYVHLYSYIYIYIYIHGNLCMSNTNIQTVTFAHKPAFIHTYLHTYIYNFGVQDLHNFQIPLLLSISRFPEFSYFWKYGNLIILEIKKFANMVISTSVLPNYSLLFSVQLKLILYYYFV